MLREIWNRVLRCDTDHLARAKSESQLTVGVVDNDREWRFDSLGDALKPERVNGDDMNKGIAEYPIRSEEQERIYDR
jgi:hypothetical protein